MSIFKRDEEKFDNITSLKNKVRRHKYGVFWRFHRPEIERNEILERILKELESNSGNISNEALIGMIQDLKSSLDKK